MLSVCAEHGAWVVIDTFSGLEFHNRDGWILRNGRIFSQAQADHMALWNALIGSCWFWRTRGINISLISSCQQTDEGTTVVFRCWRNRRRTSANRSGWMILKASSTAAISGKPYWTTAGSAYHVVFSLQQGLTRAKLSSCCLVLARDCNFFPYCIL